MVHSGVGGENLAGSTTGDVSRMFNNWMSEKSAFLKSGYRSNFKGVSYGGEDIGHYTQIVWADNTKVGCGLSYCENFSAKYLLVCRYETGNILTRPVYTPGSGSSSSHDDNKKSETTQKHSEERKTTTVHKTTTTHKVTTTVAQQATKKAEQPKENSSSHNEEKKNNESPAPVNTNTSNPVKTSIPSPVNTPSPINPPSPLETPIVPSVEGNSTVIENINKINDKSVPVEANKPTVRPDGTVETKNINKDYDKDGIIDEVGPSSYKDNTGSIVTGVALSGSVIGAAAAFVFLKRNPKQYKQLTKNVSLIKRGITKRANTIRDGANVVKRRITMKKQNSSSNLQQRVSTSLDSSDYSIDNMPMMTEMAELPENEGNYRIDLTRSLEN